VPNDRPGGPERERLSAVLWSFRQTWHASPSSFAGILACTIARGAVPAGFAIAIRGLINAATAVIENTRDGFDLLLPWLMLAFFVTLADGLATQLQQFFSERLKGNLTLDLNARVLRHAANLDLPYLENAANRDVLEQVQSDPGLKLHQFFSETQAALLAGFQIVSLVLILIWLEPLILLAVILLALPFIRFQWRLAQTRFETERNRTKKRRWTRYFLRQLTSPQTAGEIRHLGIGGLLAGRFHDTMQEFLAQDRRLQARQLVGGTLFALLTTTAFYAIFARVTYQVHEGTLTVGDLAIFGVAMTRLRTALDSGIRALARGYEQTLSITVLRDFLASQPVILELEGAQAGGFRGAIDISDLWFTYPGTDRPAVRDLSLHIAPGETVAIVGENGSGKSTLAKLLVRLYDPDRGTILLDGKPIDGYPLAWLRRNISFLGQNFGRHEASIAENIAYGDWERLSGDREAVERLARSTGLDEIAATLPDGIDTHVGREFAEHDLSGGQWQRLAIARSLALPAKLRIFDEPTSSIDARAEHTLFNAIDEASRDQTTVIISHRFSTLRMADRILVMHEGSVVEQGTHDDLMASDGRYATLYRLHESFRIREER